jgi:hypothetical protein
MSGEFVASLEEEEQPCLYSASNEGGGGGAAQLRFVREEGALNKVQGRTRDVVRLSKYYGAAVS